MARLKGSKGRDSKKRRGAGEHGGAEGLIPATPPHGLRAGLGGSSFDLVILISWRRKGEAGISFGINVKDL